MRKGLIGLVCSTGVTLLTGAAWGQCEVAQLASQGGFGHVSIDGDVAVVGDTDAFGSLGAAYVYRRGPAGLKDWKLDSVLMAPEPEVEDVFGSTVAVSGDVIVVSAYHADAPEFQIHHAGARACVIGGIDYQASEDTSKLGATERPRGFVTGTCSNGR